MTIISGQTLDQERALYGLHDATVQSCRFEGPADGESALKECGGLTIDNCDFLLRYPLWHVDDSTLSNCRMTETCRAALWYDNRITITGSHMGGIKALRECRQVKIEHSTALSTEFGWFCEDVTADDFELTSEYPFMHTSNIQLTNFRLKGKYSFQYVKDVVIRDSYLDTKDAFWHAENVTVYDSVIKGEYLAWYSKNLRLVNCKIIGTQPLCYCENLVLENCEMEGADFAFENCTVNADVKGHIISVKNPTHGCIKADSIGEIIWDEHQRPGADCQIISGGVAFKK